METQLQKIWLGYRGRIESGRLDLLIKILGKERKASCNNACFSLKVKRSVELGSNTLFICEPTSMSVFSDADSCTSEYYQSNIKHNPVMVGTTTDGQTVWHCWICVYEYVGEELPYDFICTLFK